MKRLGWTRFLRNLLVAAGNSGDVALLPAVQRYFHDERPMVREMARWAFQELARL